MPAPATDNIAITASNQVPFAPQNSDVAAGGTVNFTGSSGTVSTTKDGASIDAFTSGPPPYTVPDSYTVAPGVTGTITIEFNSSSGAGHGGPPQTGVNGTITVGSGSGGDPK